MSEYRDLRGEQARQIIDLEQVFATFMSARAELGQRYTGAMSWKTVGGKTYLYRKTADIWKSLGPRTAATEAIHEQFHEGRTRVKERVRSLTQRLDEMAPVNRALSLGRVPLIVARILRTLGGAKLIGNSVDVVGTNALFVYERLAGVQIASGLLATGDVDRLLDSRKSLKLLARDVAAKGIIGLLKTVDKSFEPIGRGGFSAANRDGYLVDLIRPAGKNPLVTEGRSQIGTAEDELKAVEIEGLAWLVNSPKVSAILIDERGYPFELVAPDPRAFALHKAWLAKRSDRDALKRGRDAAQAKLLAGLIATRLPHLAFDDPALGAMPLALRRLATDLLPDDEAGQSHDLLPNW